MLGERAKVSPRRDPWGAADLACAERVCDSASDEKGSCISDYQHDDSNRTDSAIATGGQQRDNIWVCSSLSQLGAVICGTILANLVCLSGSPLRKYQIVTRLCLAITSTPVLVSHWPMIYDLRYDSASPLCMTNGMMFDQSQPGSVPSSRTWG